MSTQHAPSLFSAKHLSMVALLLGVFSLCAAGQSSLTTLVTFESTNGNGPFAPLIQGSDGNFYGTTCCGGTTGYGTVFQLSSLGTENVLYNFCSQANCSDGSTPEGALLQAADGSFYGTTTYGGANNCGSVFNLTSTGTLTTLTSFDCTNTGYPLAGLLLGQDGNLYGTTGYTASNGGTVFRLTPSGELTVLHTFCLASDTCLDGAGPASTLVQDATGTLYGSTESGGGSNNGGTVFKVTLDGQETVLHSFCVDSNCSDGARPNGLILGSDGNLYGTTFSGGNDFAGTVFTINPAAQLNTLYLFTSESEMGAEHPSNPFAGLIQGKDGNFYGTTYAGGPTSTVGTIYSITPQGVLTLLHSLQPTEGEFPVSPLIQAADGNFYGTASMGGDVSCGGPPYFGCGTVFSLTANTQSPKQATTTKLSSSLNPSGYHQVVKLTAMVRAVSKGVPQGKITYKSGTTTLGTAALNSAGQAVLTVSTLTVGAHPITASYSGSNKYLGSRSAPMTQMVR